MAQEEATGSSTGPAWPEPSLSSSARHDALEGISHIPVFEDEPCLLGPGRQDLLAVQDHAGTLTEQRLRITGTEGEGVSMRMK